eukprot:gene20405-24439_t
MGDKKGNELGDLKTQLRNLAGSQLKENTQAKRDLFKKIISYMTISIDVAPLFSEMIMATTTTDIATKKMLYHYITHHANSNPELALLCINTLQKDCCDVDPTIRGLALRSLSSLRVSNLLEYVTEPIQRGLQDKHPYVRRTAVLGLAKLNAMNPEMVSDLDIMGSVRAMVLNDPDAQVSANALTVLTEVEGYEALAVESFVTPILKRLKSYNEWSLALNPGGERGHTFRTREKSSEIYDIMQNLEDRLQHANSAVVLATVRVFLLLTLPLPEVHQQVYERIKAPLLTLISSAINEIAYPVVAHLHLLVLRAPILFATDFKYFYCKYNDPSYIKKLKLEMLTAVADSNNMYDIVTELSEYVADVDVPIARSSVHAVGQIALEAPDSDNIVERLLLFLELGQEHITAETLIMMKDLLRKCPQHKPAITQALSFVNHSVVQEPAAKAAMVWLIGELSTEDPYVLEDLIETFADEESPDVRLELLTACVKHFFLRPPETQKLLGAALAAGCRDSHVAVHDRAIMYYRLLKHDVRKAQLIICPETVSVSTFTETHSSDEIEQLFQQFNSLSVLYRHPGFAFASPEASPVTVAGPAEDRTPAPAAVQEAPAQPPVQPAMEADLLGDLLRNDPPADTDAS